MKQLKYFPTLYFSLARYYRRTYEDYLSFKLKDLPWRDFLFLDACLRLGSFSNVSMSNVLEISACGCLSLFHLNKQNFQLSLYPLFAPIFPSMYRYNDPSGRQKHFQTLSLPNTFLLNLLA